MVSLPHRRFSPSTSVSLPPFPSPSEENQKRQKDLRVEPRATSHPGQLLAKTTRSDSVTTRLKIKGWFRVRVTVAFSAPTGAPSCPGRSRPRPFLVNTPRLPSPPPRNSSGLRLNQWLPNSRSSCSRHTCAPLTWKAVPSLGDHGVRANEWPGAHLGGGGDAKVPGMDCVSGPGAFAAPCPRPPPAPPPPSAPRHRPQRGRRPGSCPLRLRPAVGSQPGCRPFVPFLPLRPRGQAGTGVLRRCALSGAGSQRRPGLLPAPREPWSVGDPWERGVRAPEWRPVHRTPGAAQPAALRGRWEGAPLRGGRQAAVSRGGAGVSPAGSPSHTSPATRPRSLPSQGSGLGSQPDQPCVLHPPAGGAQPFSSWESARPPPLPPLPGPCRFPRPGASALVLGKALRGIPASLPPCNGVRAGVIRFEINITGKR